MTGPYFELDAPSDLSGWTTLSALWSDPAVLRAKVRSVRVSLGTGDARVAASIDFLGVAARVLSPTLRSAVVEMTVPALDPNTIWWRPMQPGPMRLAMEVGEWHEVSSQALMTDAIRPVMVPLVEAYRTSFAVSPKVLWGNVASALNGAADGLRAGHELVRDVMAIDELAGSAFVLPPHFVRRSCCLYYRLPGAGKCGDCLLVAVE